jgi:hypothetical protein
MVARSQGWEWCVLSVERQSDAYVRAKNVPL